MMCLRSLRAGMVTSTSPNNSTCPRYLSLLLPTPKERLKNLCLPLTFMIKNNGRKPNPVEDAAMLKQQFAKNNMAEGLANSIITSMLRTDYVRSLHLPDTLSSYLGVLTLHIYPLMAKLKEYDDSEIVHIKKHIATKLHEDLKARLMISGVDRRTAAKLEGGYRMMSATGYLHLDEGIGSECGKELAGGVARLLYSQCESGPQTMQQLLLVSEWLMETMDLLHSMDNDEFTDLCVFGEGFSFPLLGTYRPVKPDKLYTWIDVHKAGGELPPHLQKIAHPASLKYVEPPVDSPQKSILKSTPRTDT